MLSERSDKKVECFSSSSVYSNQLGEVSPFNIRRRFRDLRPHPLREMNPLKSKFFSEKNILYLVALANRIADVSDVVDANFTRDEILVDMHETYNIFDGSETLQALRAGVTNLSQMAKNKKNLSIKIERLNESTEKLIRARIEIRLRDQALLRTLGVGNFYTGLRGRPRVMETRPVVQTRHGRGSRGLPGSGLVDAAGV